MIRCSGGYSFDDVLDVVFRQKEITR
jgi:hypothetical protein